MSGAAAGKRHLAPPSRAWQAGGVEGVGRLLVLAGLVLVALGVVLGLAPRIPWLGRLPGDLVIERGRVTIYVPIVTSVVVSLLLTLVLNLLSRR